MPSLIKKAGDLGLLGLSIHEDYGGMNMSFNTSMLIADLVGITGSFSTAYGAHTGDKKYPDCRPSFTKKIESAFNQGEIDGIKKKLRKKIQIWSPDVAKISKKRLIFSGHKILGDKIFDTWSCYLNRKSQCGNCESCNNRKEAFVKAGISDKTKYLK